MRPLSEVPTQVIEEEIPYTFILGLKELVILSTILLVGFSGFSLCFDKIFIKPAHQKDIVNITMYTPDINDAYLITADENFSADIAQ
jgi:hypothetical protein